MIDPILLDSLLAPFRTWLVVEHEIQSVRPTLASVRAILRSCGPLPEEKELATYLANQPTDMHRKIRWAWHLYVDYCEESNLSEPARFPRPGNDSPTTPPPVVCQAIAALTAVVQRRLVSRACWGDYQPETEEGPVLRIPTNRNTGAVQTFKLGPAAKHALDVLHVWGAPQGGQYPIVPVQPLALAPMAPKDLWAIGRSPLSKALPAAPTNLPQIEAVSPAPIHTEAARSPAAAPVAGSDIRLPELPLKASPPPSWMPPPPVPQLHLTAKTGITPVHDAQVEELERSGKLAEMNATEKQRYLQDVEEYKGRFAEWEKRYGSHPVSRQALDEQAPLRTQMHLDVEKATVKVPALVQERDQNPPPAAAAPPIERVARRAMATTPQAPQTSLGKERLRRALAASRAKVSTREAGGHARERTLPEGPVPESLPEVGEVVMTDTDQNEVFEVVSEDGDEAIGDVE